MMQRRRRRSAAVVLLQKILACAICNIALVGLLSGCVHVFPSSRVSDLSDPYKFPTVTKLVGASGNPNFEKLWKLPEDRDFVPCIRPSSNYTIPDQSRGYLLVRTNGGLYQMRTGICDMVAIARIINATLAKSDSRLANNGLPPDIQKLRCRACYEELCVAPQIEAMGKVIGLIFDVIMSQESYSLMVVSSHRIYDMRKIMLAFSGCTHGLSNAEAKEMKTIRQKTAHWKVKNIDARVQRAKGRFPLTPKRKKLASVEECVPFTNHSSQMAALDYIVYVESDVFIPSYPGNMAKDVEGHRLFLGHKKTISPDRKGLVRLFEKFKGVLEEGTKVSDRIIEIHKKWYDNGP
ncbi:hypothetical protein F3Y22_tig00112498pilonHSYRG00202 [Hibiscus syriacus]|uniref:O-fucosyltransferase family protein n=1 Tax=Hibiscus syriacus TaxID=106335 RepID=A0A6A2XH06_HIBSY|nr:hypothetical protein F3Y22_tig00112498pilonHSYRG00202 [Hibiscus syriacus]